DDPTSPRSLLLGTFRRKKLGGAGGTEAAPLRCDSGATVSAAMCRAAYNSHAVKASALRVQHARGRATLTRPGEAALAPSCVVPRRQSLGSAASLSPNTQRWRLILSLSQRSRTRQRPGT